MPLLLEESYTVPEIVAEPFVRKRLFVTDMPLVRTTAGALEKL